ncbi:MAG: FecR domain-containing protein [Pseudomonadota bacterium]|nr:FecR domain-containing protein [Pseudomonadota bacterium]
MKTCWLALGSFFFLVVAPCSGADMGMITLVDGKPKVLRGTAWFILSEGVRVRDGDVLDIPDKSQLELELTDGSAVGVIGPGALYAVSLAPPDVKQSALAELFLTRGWLKLETKPPGARLRIRTPHGTATAADGAAVMHVAGDAIEMFVETGAVKLTDASKPEAAGSEIKGGGFVTRASGKPVELASRAPSTFVAAMPRDFMDPLPKRATKFVAARADPAPDHDATFAEAQPWLSGPYRTAFMKRFEPKLSDPAFRTAVEANAKAMPEWSVAAKPKAEAKVEPPPPPPKEAEKPKQPERTWHWPWETPKK